MTTGQGPIFKAQDLAEEIKESGLRPTQARVLVFKVLLEADRPLNHAEIRSCEGIAEIDRVTVYRNLASLERHGLVHKVQGLDGSWLHCAHDAVGRCRGNHAHFICTQCGDARCLLDNPLCYVHLPEGYVVEGKQMVAYGLCPTCASEESEDS